MHRVRTGCARRKGRECVCRGRTCAHTREFKVRGPSKVHALSRPVYASVHACARRKWVTGLGGCTWVHNIALAPTPTTRTPHRRRGFLRREENFLFSRLPDKLSSLLSILLRVSWEDKLFFGGRFVLRLTNFLGMGINLIICDMRLYFKVRVCLRKYSLFKYYLSKSKSYIIINKYEGELSFQLDVSYTIFVDLFRYSLHWISININRFK